MIRRFGLFENVRNGKFPDMGHQKFSSLWPFSWSREIMDKVLINLFQQWNTCVM